MAFALTQQSDDSFDISNDIRKSLDKNSYLCFFDASPLLPSKLLKNYLVKLNHFYNKISTDAKPGDEIILKVISIRDKISKLSDSITLTETFYMEVKLIKTEEVSVLKIEEINHLNLKPIILSLQE